MPGTFAPNFGRTSSVNDIKEQFCYVALDFASATALEQAYELPNGDMVTLGTEHFRCPEALFQPALIGNQGEGIHTLLYQTIMSCPAELQAALFANIVLAGGATLLPGLPERLKKELTALAPPETNVEIIALPARNHLAWGGQARQQVRDGNTGGSAAKNMLIPAQVSFIASFSKRVASLRCQQHLAHVPVGRWSTGTIGSSPSNNHGAGNTPPYHPITEKRRQA